MIPNVAKKMLPKAKHPNHKHCAIVYRGGNIVATGVNHDEVHAEVQALKKLWPDHRKGTTVLSVRMTAGGNMGMAKPCKECEAYMREWGVKKVVYSTNDGSMERMKL